MEEDGSNRCDESKEPAAGRRQSALAVAVHASIEAATIAGASESAPSRRRPRRRPPDAAAVADRHWPPLAGRRCRCWSPLVAAGRWSPLVANRTRSKR